MVDGSTRLPAIRALYHRQRVDVAEAWTPHMPAPTSTCGVENESRRRKIGWLRGHVFPEGSRFAEQCAHEIAQLDADIRAEGEEP